MNAPLHHFAPFIPVEFDSIELTHPDQAIAFLDESMHDAIDVDDQFDSESDQAAPFSMEQLIDLEESLYRVLGNPHSGFSVITPLDTLRCAPCICATDDLLQLCRYSCAALRSWLSECTPMALHPYVIEHLRYFGDLDMIRLLQSPCSTVDQAYACVSHLNQRLASLKFELASPRVQRAVARFTAERCFKPANLAKYMSEMFECYGRLLLIRLDVGYHQGMALNPVFAPQTAMISSPYDLVCQSLQSLPAPRFIPFDEIRQHRNNLLKFIRDRFSSNFCGYIWKLEYGLQKGYHYHLMLFFNGAQLRKDVMIGKLIGDHWNEVITAGHGVYYNCNASTQQYQHRCIGAMSWKTPDLQTGMSHVASYLAKQDLYVRQDLPRYQRIIGTGWSPLRRRGNAPRRGRPRTPLHQGRGGY